MGRLRAGGAGTERSRPRGRRCPGASRGCTTDGRAGGRRSNLLSRLSIPFSAPNGVPGRSMTAVALPEPVLTDPTTTDPDVTLAASGDRRAFERLYHAHVNRVFSLFARMVPDRVRAEELTQDAFVRARETLQPLLGERT